MKDCNNLANKNVLTSPPTVVGGYSSSSASPSITVVGNPSPTTSSNTTTTSDDHQHHQKSSLLFDYVNKEIDEDLVCPICFYPFIDPMTHSACGNTFCSECIKSIPNCPMCSEVGFKNNCSPSAKTIRNMLDKLKVKCDMCKNTVLRSELKDHKEKYCPLHDAYKQVDELKLKLEEEFNQKNEQLKSEYFELIKQLKNEKEQSIKDAKENLIMKERELILKVKSNDEELEKRIQEFDKQVLDRKKLESSNKPIHINVRGTIMTVSLGDFIHNEREPDNLFKKMFDGQHPIYETPSNTFKDSVYYIDCDPVIFKHLLEWLKFGRLANELSGDMKNSLFDASDMFNLNNLSKKLENSNNSKEKVKMSQIDFMNLTNLARSQKISLNLSGLDLRGLVLQNTNLEKCEIISSDFSGMNLTHAKFKGSILRGSNFSNCDLSNVDFNGCDLSECNFSNAILKKTDMSNTNLFRTLFENAKLEKTKFQQCKFKKTLGLNGRKLISLDFTKSTFVECSFKDSDLSHSNFSNTSLSKCNLENTILKSSNFENSQFKNVKFNSDCKFEETILKNCSLQNVSGLINISVNNVDFSNCKLENSEIIVNSIINSNLSNSNIRVLLNNISTKVLVDCNLSGCNLSNQDFTGFQFTNVNFSNTILDGSNFKNVTFNKCSIKQHFKKNMFLKDCKLIDCNWNGSIFEEIDYNVIESLLLTNLFNECTFKKCDLTLLKDLSNFKGNTFDGCLFNFEQFTNNSIDNIQFNNIDFPFQTILKFKFNNVKSHNCKLDSKPLPSTIVNDIGIFFDAIMSHTNSKSIPQLLYRGTRDGFKPEDFHSRCDGFVPTLTIIKSAEPYNQIFGGFTTRSWNSPNYYISDYSAFIFKIDENNQFRKFNLRKGNNYAISVATYSMPSFGGDFSIGSDCNLNNNSSSDFGYVYELPPPNNNGESYQYGSEKAKSYLAGSERFKVSEIEVFQIIR